MRTANSSASSLAVVDPTMYTDNLDVPPPLHYDPKKLGVPLCVIGALAFKQKAALWAPLSFGFVIIQTASKG